MKTLKKKNLKNAKIETEIINLNELLKIRGGEQPTQGDPTQRDIDFD